MLAFCFQSGFPRWESKEEGAKMEGCGGNDRKKERQQEKEEGRTQRNLSNLHSPPSKDNADPVSLGEGVFEAGNVGELEVFDGGYSISPRASRQCYLEAKRSKRGTGDRATHALMKGQNKEELGFGMGLSLR
jgi:hypothetical protein